MKALIPLILLFSFSLNAQTVYQKELRGVWITNVASDVLNSKEKIAAAMDYLAKNGFNVVYPVVWNKGYTLYPSATMQTLFNKDQDPYFKNQLRDPLQEIIVEAHRNGMEVVPWYEFGFSSSYSENGGHIIAGKPHWAAKNQTGGLLTKNGFEWMNPYHPEVQTFIMDLFKETIRGYDIDGVQGDDRLPANPSEGGYDTFTVDLYKAEHNGANPPTNTKDYPWLQWRANKLTNFLGRLYRMTKQENPNVMVSMSPSPYGWGFEEYLQDIPSWVDSSYVDFISPQFYRRNVSDYTLMVQASVGPTVNSTGGYIKQAHRKKLFPGIVSFASGAFTPPNIVRGMVQKNRDFGIKGEVFFYWEGMGSRNAFLADTLKKYFYQKPAVIPGRTNLWRPPALVLNETDASVVKTGTWVTESTAVGYQGNMLTATSASGATITYPFTLPYSGTFDVYAFDVRFNTNATNSAKFEITANGSTTPFVLDQRSTYTSGWQKIGQVTASSGATVEVKMLAGAVTDSRSSFADGVMLLLNRKLSPATNVPIVLPNDTEEAPQNVELAPVYPNPFTQNATISFSLKTQEAVHLSVYDVLGRQVAVLLNNQVLADGEHKIPFNGSTLSSGVYFYKLNTTNGTQTGKMVIQR
jgi:uncharacterized lipoprotein YddW (UPF0748 family)